MQNRLCGLGILSQSNDYLNIMNNAGGTESKDRDAKISYASPWQPRVAFSPCTWMDLFLRVLAANGFGE
jgi:hypothetical protein